MAAPPSTELEAGQATGQLGPERRLAGAVRFADLDADGRPSLALTSWEAPSCGLVDWGDGREGSWSVVRLPAEDGPVELSVYEGRTAERERWSLALAEVLRGSLELRGDSGRLVHDGAVVHFRLRDCGPQRL